MRTIGLIAAALVMSTAPAAIAGEGCGSDELAVVEHIFDAADLDRDGSLTASEYQDAGLDHYGVSFEDSDANADGLTSLVEYLELYERHHPPADRIEA